MLPLRCTLVTVQFVVLLLLPGLVPPLAPEVHAQESIPQIDFETIPGDTPREGLVISDQFAATAGVSFALEGGGHPVLAEVGGEGTAFLGPPDDATPDTPAPDQQIGQYFLTDDGTIGAVSPNLIVNYDPPTAATSGVVLDVDNNETYTIEARDASDTVLQTVTISAGDPGTGDGLMTKWSFDRQNADIFSLRFLSGSPGALFGLGFDNFNARSASDPPSSGTVYLPLVIRASTDTSQPARPDQVTDLSVDTQSRDAVRQFFVDHYQSYHNLDHYALADWNGSVNSCNPGNTSEAFRTHTLHRLNFFRAMAGVPARVTLNDEYTQKAQAAALIMSANGQRSHTPPPTWQCYTTAGSDGALASNLFTGRAGIYAVDGYIEDAGTQNKDTGHRWWNLSPYMGQVGVGAALPESGTIADALYISDSSNRNPTTARDYIAWPPPGFVPYQVVYTRWSFTLFSDKPFTEDMTSAVVAMETNGQSVPVEIIYNGTGQFNNHLVWVPLGRDTENSDAPWPRPTADTTYTVTIQNVLVDGTPRTFTYDVTVFDPAV